MSESNRIEREFGVPFPGAVVDQSKWAQTALKAMPAGHMNWPELFGRAAGVPRDLSPAEPGFTAAPSIPSKKGTSARTIVGDRNRESRGGFYPSRTAAGRSRFDTCDGGDPEATGCMGTPVCRVAPAHRANGDAEPTNAVGPRGLSQRSAASRPLQGDQRG
jgi:hypothetical protein